MVLKQIDDKSLEIDTLKKLLEQSNSETQKNLIIKDLKMLENGYQSEQENAYYLNFEFEDGKRSVLLHDIRLEHNGKTAQFDHILITGIGITILESKSFKGILTINQDNSLTIQYGKETKTYPNPIEQNNRHKKVLNDFINDHFEMSLRLKILGGIKIEHKVLIHPNTTVTNKKLPENFVRSDSFATIRDKEIDTMGTVDIVSTLATVLTIDQIKEIAKLLMSHHKPIKFDYSMKYRIGSHSSKVIDESADTQNAIQTVFSEVIQCPRCKEGNLVKRKRKLDKYAGKYKSDEFLGCSRFPKCKYTQEIV